MSNTADDRITPTRENIAPLDHPPLCLNHLNLFRLADGTGIKVEVWSVGTSRAELLMSKAWTWGQLVNAPMEGR